MESIARNYFEFWNNHDLDNLKKMFSDDVELQDWENNFFGIENVLNENKNIFSTFPKIKAEIVDIASSKKKLMVQIVVFLDDNETLNVVDVITIHSGLITNIKAYKC